MNIRNFLNRPQNQVVRTKPEMQAILGDKYDLALFDWRLGKFQTSQKSKRSEEVSDASNAKGRLITYFYLKYVVMRMDNMLTFPTRRSAPHLGDVKPVIVRSHPDCKRTDSKTVNQEGPHQVIKYFVIDNLLYSYFGKNDLLTVLLLMPKLVNLLKHLIYLRVLNVSFY